MIYRAWFFSCIVALDVWASNIAMMPFQAQGADPVYAVALADKVKTELTASGAFQVLERAAMDQILMEQGFQQSGVCDGSACLVEAGRLLGVDQMVGGSLSKAGETFVAVLSLVDVETGKILGSVDVTIPASSDTLFHRVPKELVHKLRIVTDTNYAKAEQERIRAAQMAAEEVKKNVQKDQQSFRRTLAWSLAAAALVSLGSAGYFHMDAQKKFDKADEFDQSYDAATSTSQAEAFHTAVQDQTDKGNRSILIRNGFGMAGILCAGASVYFFF